MNLLTVKPAESFGLENVGTLKVGSAADLVVLDIESEEKINPDEFLSKGRNTPFGGWTCKGWPVITIVDGKIAWRKGRVKA